MMKLKLIQNIKALIPKDKSHKSSNATDSSLKHSRKITTPNQRFFLKHFTKIKHFCQPVNCPSKPLYLSYTSTQSALTVPVLSRLPQPFCIQTLSPLVQAVLHNYSLRHRNQWQRRSVPEHYPHFPDQYCLLYQ